jgi:hypothetical protein
VVALGWLIGFACGVYWAERPEKSPIVTVHESPTTDATVAKKPEAPRELPKEQKKAADTVVVHEPVADGTAITEPQVPPERQVTKLLFGVRLGETMAGLKARVNVEPSQHSYADEDFPAQLWDVDNRDPNVIALRVSSFDNRILEVSVDFKDNSQANFGKVREQLAQKYHVRHEDLGNILSGEAHFDTTIDGMLVGMHLKRGMSSTGDARLNLRCIHRQLSEQAMDEFKRRRATKVRDDL